MKDRKDKTIVNLKNGHEADKEARLLADALNGDQNALNKMFDGVVTVNYFVVSGEVIGGRGVKTLKRNNEL